MKKVVISAILIVLVAGIAGFGYWYYALRGESVPQSTTKPLTAEEKASQLVDEASQAEDGNVSKQANKLKELANETSNSEDKETYLAGLFDVYTNAGDNAAAFGAAKEYEETSESALSAAALARSYSLKGDYKNAAKYYGIAASRSEKPSSSTERAPYNDYMILKKEAESHL